MEKFIVSARKYRPKTFDTVVGQDSITNTLKNAIVNNQLAQAFLFCGPRGIGKTTCARILAKTINCFNISQQTEACNKCESCTSFDEQHSFNIYELDAASNNSVEDIRNLVDQVRIPPQLGDRKIYIIDEVHMLSQAAFNAFLKTLEEPPSHAIFILATTEKHKIIPTILSRCQIFDFKRIGVEDVAGHLAKICDKEKIKFESDALHIIGQKADGAMRDGLSILDRMVSFNKERITYKETIENLNILDYEYYFKILDFALKNNIPSALLLFNEVLKKGFDGHDFINGLGEHLRNILVCVNPKTLELLEVGETVKEKYRDQANSFPPNLIMGSLEICNECDIKYKSSSNQRLLIELGLMQICSLNIEDGLKKKTP
jgi:DNA polymerase-3 subunit gamma/tau